MIVALDGILQSISADSVVLKVGPVSLEVHMPVSVIAGLGSPGDAVSIRTYLHYREDAIALYGFTSAEQLFLFRKLLTVTGVGPKVALGLLSGLSADKLASAIINNDMDALTQISGVGKKIAARLVVELKSTLEKEWKGETSAVFVREDTEVVSALLSLGYSLKEAKQAASMISGDGLGLEEKLRLALRNLSKT